MLPVLTVLGDGQPHKASAIIKTVGEQLSLTTDDLAQLLPSGKMTTFPNRIYWAITYLSKAGLLSRPSRGMCIVTERGRSVLDSGIECIDNEFLGTFAEFKSFR
jgi:restriction system protein